MMHADIEKIEKKLGVTLPEDYCGIVLDYPFEKGSVDDLLWDDADSIIDMTSQHREGFHGAPPWPKELVFVGDDGAGCPYALDTRSQPARLLKFEQGDPQRLLEEHADIRKVVDDYRVELAARLPELPLSTTQIVLMILGIAAVAAGIGIAFSRFVLLG